MDKKFCSCHQKGLSDFSGLGYVAIWNLVRRLLGRGGGVMGTQKRWLESGKVVRVTYGLAGCVGKACSQLNPLLSPAAGISTSVSANFQIWKH